MYVKYLYLLLHELLQPKNPPTLGVAGGSAGVANMFLLLGGCGGPGDGVYII